MFLLVFCVERVVAAEVDGPLDIVLLEVGLADHVHVLVDIVAHDAFGVLGLLGGGVAGDGGEEAGGDSALLGPLLVPEAPVGNILIFHSIICARAQRIILFHQNLGPLSSVSTPSMFLS